MFTTDYESDNLLPEGTYECIIKAAFVNATPSGREYFSVRLIIRNDVPQKYQNKNIFHAVWKKREPTPDDMKIDGFSYKQIMNLCRAAGIQKGKSYDSLDELGKDLAGKCILVTIEHSTYNGQTTEKVKYTNETKHPNCTHGLNTNNNSINTVNTSDEDDIEFDDDLPF